MRAFFWWLFVTAEMTIVMLLAVRAM